MSKVRLRLEFDSEDKTFRCGDSVSGRVVVEVLEDYACSHLRVTLGWRTWGDGDTYRKTCERKELEIGKWKAGEEKVFPFQLRLPDGPAGQAGDLVSVSYVVKAEVGAAWSTSEEAQTALKVNPGPKTYEHARKLAKPHAGATDHAAVTLGCAGLLIAAGGAATYAAVTAKGDPLEPTIVAVLCLLLTLLALYFALHNSIAQRRVGVVFVGLEPLIQAGQKLTCLLRFQPTRSVEIHGIEAVLQGEERATRGSGKKKRVKLNELFKATRALSGPRELKAGEVFEEEVVFELPEDAAPSLDVTGNSIKWKLDLTVDIAGWPDWAHSYPLQVAPVCPPSETKLRVSARLGDSQVCPYCKDGFSEWGPEATTTCAGCKTVFHKQCIREFGSCSTRGCRRSGLRA